MHWFWKALRRLTFTLLVKAAACGIGIVLLAGFSVPLVPKTDALPRYVVERVCGDIVIDGYLSEESWRRAATMGNFVLSDGSGVPQSTTRATMLWDSTYLYVGFECYDTDIIATMKKRDSKLWEEEVVELFLAPSAPEQRGYTEIEISPLNTVLDLYVREVRGTMPIALPYSTYNLSIRSAVHVRGTPNISTDTDTLWTVEIALPLEELQLVNLPPIADGDVWNVNLYRIERFPRRELIAWSPTMQNKFHVPSRFGSVLFSMKQVGK
ncbi:MAG: carbohydrate-binding family 9-like protein [Bacteroidota bacterium]|nr:carbohydrate-binding family 9-like protein [Candidatus Kapabacteria bacterium]MDW8219303.1 carbohydrate-binding family 9-like protein [Bacteroidota bacterium]